MWLFVNGNKMVGENKDWKASWRALGAIICSSWIQKPRNKRWGSMWSRVGPGILVQTILPTDVALYCYFLFQSQTQSRLFCCRPTRHQQSRTLQTSHHHYNHLPFPPTPNHLLLLLPQPNPNLPAVLPPAELRYYRRVISNPILPRLDTTTWMPNSIRLSLALFGTRSDYEALSEYKISNNNLFASLVNHCTI